jgi:hypothetical protein
MSRRNFLADILHGSVVAVAGFYNVQLEYRA